MPLLAPIETFLAQIIRFLSTYHSGYSLPYFYWHISVNMWTTTWRFQYHSAFEKWFLSLFVRASEVMVKPSTFLNIGLLFFESRNFGKCEPISWYYGPLVYSFLSGKQQTENIYGYGYMGVIFVDL